MELKVKYTDGLCICRRERKRGQESLTGPLGDRFSRPIPRATETSEQRNRPTTPSASKMTTSTPGADIKRGVVKIYHRMNRMIQSSEGGRGGHFLARAGIQLGSSIRPFVREEPSSLHLSDRIDKTSGSRIQDGHPGGCPSCLSWLVTEFSFARSVDPLRLAQASDWRLPLRPRSRCPRRWKIAARRQTPGAPCRCLRA